MSRPLTFNHVALITAKLRYCSNSGRHKGGRVRAFITETFELLMKTCAKFDSLLLNI